MSPDDDESAEPEVLGVPDEAGGARLDAFLARALPRHSRSRWRRLIDAGHVAVGERAVRPALKLAGGERVEIDEPPPSPSRLLAQDIPLDVVFEDEHLLVVDKPAGLVVHPAAGHPDMTLVNALLFRVPGLSVGGEERPGIVHRLDKDTSGLIVCAKHDDAHRALGDAFRAREVDKRYVGFALGDLGDKAGHVVTGHARHPTDRRRFTTRPPPPDEGEGPTGGVRRAEAVYAVRAFAGGVSEVEVELLTGRTHQIRAQLKDLGHPLCGDALYGGAKPQTRVGEGPVRRALAQLGRQALHAARLRLTHPMTGALLELEAPLPEDLARVRAALAEALD